MFKKVVLLIAIFALAASAASYHVTFTQTTMVKGNELKAGEYRLNVTDTTVTLVGNKKSVEVPVKIESSDKKFDSTAVRYTAGDKPTVTEIRLGGTKTRLVFSD